MGHAQLGLVALVACGGAFSPTPSEYRFDNATHVATEHTDEATVKLYTQDVVRDVAARDFGCDMLAMGAYSHSRLRQLILGGVTRHVLEHGSLPIMMNR